MARVKPKAIVLLSGGADSTTTLAVAREEGFATYALTFRYGQRHSHELDCAAAIAKSFDVVEHVVFDVNIGAFGGSALTSDIAVPKNRSDAQMADGIPVTYVPARNTVFLSIALAWAEVVGSSDIFIGVNALDYSGYPDCRPEFIAAYEAMANLATKAAVEGHQRLRIHAPLVNLTKADILRKGTSLGVPYELTSSCYDPTADGRPCGQCDACVLRVKGFREAGLQDPLVYATDSTS